MSIVAFNFLSDISTYVPLNIKVDKNKEQCSVPSLVEVVLEKKSWILHLSQRPYTGWMHERAPYYGYIEIKLLPACMAGQLVSCKVGSARQEFKPKLDTHPKTLDLGRQLPLIIFIQMNFQRLNKKCYYLQTIILLFFSMVLSKQQALVTLRWNTTPKILSNGSLEYHFWNMLPFSKKDKFFILFYTIFCIFMIKWKIGFWLWVTHCRQFGVN